MTAHDELQIGPRTTIRRGDWFRATAGPYWSGRDSQGQRVRQLPGHGGEVSHELVRALADYAAALVVRNDAVEKIGSLQQVERFGAFLVIERDGHSLRLHGLLKGLVL